MTTSTQSFTLNQLLDAIGTVLQFGDGNAPGTGLNENYIQECYTRYRPRSGEPYEITYGVLPETPFMYAGAGRLGHNTAVVVKVTLYTRLELDFAGSDYAWSRDTTYGALVMRTKIVDCLQDSFLFSSYDPITHLPTGLPLVIEGLQQLPSPGPRKPDTDTTATDDGGDVGGYGEHDLFFQAMMVQSLTTAP